MDFNTARAEPHFCSINYFKSSNRRYVRDTRAEQEKKGGKVKFI
jgi:hypothetical protein